MNINNPLDEFINDNFIDNQAITTTTQYLASNDTNKSIFSKYYDYAQQKLNIIYKAIEEYEISLYDEKNFYKIMLYAVKNQDTNKIKDLFMQDPVVFGKTLFLHNYILIIAIKDNNTEIINTFLYCIFKNNQETIISKYLKENLFIYACQHPDNYYSDAIIQIYKSESCFFKPSYIQTIHDLYINKDIIAAINTVSSVEDRINSKKSFKARYFLNQAEIFKSVDYLDLDMHYLKLNSENIFSSAKTFISNLKNVAIYLTSGYNPIKEKKFYTFGDETACLNILDQLSYLGLKQATIYINPPDKSGMIVRKFYFSLYDYFVYSRKKNYIIKKLSLLLDGINPNLGLPQTIIKNGCTINIKFIDEIINDSESWQQKIKNYIESTVGMKYPNNDEVFFSSIVNENLVLAFSKSGLLENSQHLNKIIKLLPFLFETKDQMIQDGTIKFKYPFYSILRDQKVNLPLQYIGVNAHKNWLFDLLAKTKSNEEAEVLSTIINLVALNIKSKKLHHGTVYGIHHRTIKKNAEAILASWINSLNKLSSEINKPIVLSVISNSLSIDKQQFYNNKTKVIDLSKCNNKTNYLDQINYFLENNNTIVLFFPALPKPVFHYLVDNTTMPILVEGANITSYALQQGKPYLSVLPTGRTPIPTKMGDPWIAFLTKALSYKLLFDKELTDHFTILFNYVTKRNYQQALDYLIQFNQAYKPTEKNIAIKFFCKENLDERLIIKTEEITLLSLLKKGDTLSENSHKYLLQALDPNFTSIATYIKNCLDENSKERYHTRLMQHHVNLPINDKLVMALHKFIDEFKKNT